MEVLRSVVEVLSAGEVAAKSLQGEGEAWDTEGAELVVVDGAESVGDPELGTTMVCSQRSKSESAD